MFVLLILWAVLAIEPLEHAPHIYVLVLMALVVLRTFILIQCERRNIQIPESLQ